MRLTLLVTTYNRPDALQLVLQSAAHQRVLPDEVVIADDGSGAPTRAVVDAFRATAPFPVRHAWQEDIGFRLAASRNRGLEQATGDYVVMIDGDMLLHRDVIADHRRFARSGSYVQGSRVMLGQQETERVLREGVLDPRVFTPGTTNRQNAIRLPWLSSFISTAQTPLKRTRGCHLAFFMQDALAINGFDEAFEGWGREDSDFVARLMHTGIARRNLKFAAIAYHLWHRTAPSAVSVNHELFERTIAERRTWCERGLRRAAVAP